jgi:hypothetical protein
MLLENPLPLIVRRTPPLVPIVVGDTLERAAVDVRLATDTAFPTPKNLYLCSSPPKKTIYRQ